MPLHDWNDLPGWTGVRHLWISELLGWMKSCLPEGFRVYIRSEPNLATDAPQPDVEIGGPDIEPTKALHVEKDSRLVSAVELVSPCNKDCPDARANYLARYLGYLREGVHLLLVDVHRRPLNFSFADRIAEELRVTQPPTPPPLAVGYRVGEPAATGGRFLAIWRRPLTVGGLLPTMDLPVTVSLSVKVDLEETYNRAAAGAYLD
jgi:hypothetical protein